MLLIKPTRVRKYESKLALRIVVKILLTAEPVEAKNIATKSLGRRQRRNNLFHLVLMS